MMLLVIISEASYSIIYVEFFIDTDKQSSISTILLPALLLLKIQLSIIRRISSGSDVECLMMFAASL